MPRRPRILTGLALSCLLLVGVYSALPRLISGILESWLVDRGFTHAAVISGYPSWDRLNLNELRLVRRDESGSLAIQVFGVTVNYSPWELLAGRIDGIHLARVEVERVPAPGDAAPAATQADTGTAIVTPGQWLAELPMEELSVDALHVSWRDGDAVQSLSATGLFKDGQALVRGQIHPADSQALELSARLSENGEMHLAVRLPGQQVSPILNLDNRVSQYTEGAMKIEGSLQAQLGPLAALLGSWFDWGESPGKLEGSMDSRW
ncbi:MAG: hypothetical protein H6R26_2455, partial [Proteobacteria bacterium]|nr:hypothetical protein [Pseudomonadota bacterium]